MHPRGAIPLPLLPLHRRVCWVAHGRGKLCPGAEWLFPHGDMNKVGSGAKVGGESRTLKYLQISKSVFYTIDGSSLLWTWRLTIVLASLLSLARERWSMGSHLSCINKYLTNDHVCQAP